MNYPYIYKLGFSSTQKFGNVMTKIDNFLFMLSVKVFQQFPTL